MVASPAIRIKRILSSSGRAAFATSFLQQEAEREKQKTRVKGLGEGAGKGDQLRTRDQDQLREQPSGN